MGLLDNLIQEAKKYVRDALPGGLLNPEVGAYLDKAGNNIIAGHKQRDAVQRGLLADPMNSELQKQAFRDGMDLAGMAPLGITAWHGSPHKFDKFSLDKIGTGEGAQAYGHGLYFAERPGVAQSYREGLSKGPPLVNGAPYNFDDVNEFAAAILAQNKGDKASAINFINGELKFAKPGSNAELKLNEALLNIQHNGNLPKAELPGYTYKTDIPDEAAARFLDWDKPVPEDVRQRISKVAMEQFGSGSTGTSGKHLYKEIARELGNPAVRNASPDASAWLAQQGIPGIRYLDGGSRSAGQGSSNFVVFDPEMIRIIERNGQATGLKPWAPGEYQGLLR